MHSPIRILGIAPYEGLKALMAPLASVYPDVELTLFVGDLEQGLEIARSNFHGNYDVVISRGGTAKMLRRHLVLPVVEIETSMYDILCTLKLAGNRMGKTAMVAYDNITNSARLLCQLMTYDIDIFTVEERSEVEPILRQLQKDDYQTVLCDMIGNTTAKRIGMDSFLITSGIDSVRSAFQRAVQLCRSQEHLRDENLFFRSLIHGQIGHTVVLDDNGNLFFSSLDELSPAVVDLLMRELPESKTEPERRIIRNLEGMLYSIRSKRITAGNLSYIAFFFDARKTPLSPSQVGIRFSSRPEAEQAFYDSIFSFAGTMGDLQDQIDQLNHSTAPVMVSGEDGTGKETIVSVLYLRSTLQNNPLVSINCSMLNERSWTFLLEHPSSPLSDGGNTIYFASIDVLAPERQRQLLAVLTEMDVCRRNRVVFSCVCQPGESMSVTGSLFMDKLCCLSLHLPPLRQMAQRIPTLVSMSLSHLNVGMARQIVGAEPDAMELLKNFQWPHNYTQFRRVVCELAVTASGQTVTAEDVRQVLRKERHVGAFLTGAENAAAPLDLSRSLNEINRDIARRVVEESGGNQTAAAKRLGISRTTLWRLLQTKR